MANWDLSPSKAQSARPSNPYALYDQRTGKRYWRMPDRQKFTMDHYNFLHKVLDEIKRLRAEYREDYLNKKIASYNKCIAMLYIFIIPTIIASFFISFYLFLVAAFVCWHVVVAFASLDSHWLKKDSDTGELKLFSVYEVDGEEVYIENGIKKFVFKHPVHIIEEIHSLSNEENRTYYYHSQLSSTLSTIERILQKSINEDADYFMALEDKVARLGNRASPRSTSIPSRIATRADLDAAGLSPVKF